MVDKGRRGLFASISAPLKRKQNKTSEPIRPPYQSDLSLFETRCPECEHKACATACEEAIIIIDENGTPTLNLSEKGCTFCDACREVCDADVLSDETVNFLIANVEIDVLKCMAWHQVMCHSCKEPCLEDAIEFLGLFRPSIDPGRCTACGWCIGVCPAAAITIEPAKKEP
jgi:ferredoxin-type protein NapF